MEERDLKGFAQQGILGILVFLLFSSVAYGATYYVRLDGSNGNNGLTNTSGGAWRTIDWAGDHVSAGDVVRVQAGAYAERVTPGVNGTAVANTVTFVADGAVTVCGFTFSGNAYIRVIGFTLDGNAGCAMPLGVVSLSGANRYLEFWNNTIRDGAEDGIRVEYGASDRLNNSLIVGNTFTAISYVGSSNNGKAARIVGSNNLIAYNEITDIFPDGFYLFGTYNRVLNTYTHGLHSTAAGHSDVFQTGSDPSVTVGFSYNLLESTFQLADAQTQEHTAQISNATSGFGTMTNNIIRRNVWHNVGEYPIGMNQATAGGITYTRYYNNTTADAQAYTPDNGNKTYGNEWYSAGVDYGFLYNNIEYDSWGANVTTNLMVYDLEFSHRYLDYNLAFDPDGNVTFASPWTAQVHPRSNADPAFTDYANNDFTIGATSGARATAGPLTTVSGSGTGTTFNVATAGGGFFVGSGAAGLPQYGGHLVVGDTITVGTTTRTIASISGDAITVTSPFTWADGDPVYFGSSATPDIGAYPYQAGGYTLTAAYAESGSTVTVRPSDAELVRFVVCYEDGIPTAVANASPYTCTVGSGSLSVRVYPLYASKTLSVTAAPVAGLAPAAPTNVMIIR